MRTALSSLVLLALVGCKDKAAPAKKAVTPPLDAAAVAVVVDAAPEVSDAIPPPLTPPPPGGRGVQIFDLQYGGFAQPGLPAIKEDGSEVLVTAVADDGGRGYLDLRLLVIDGSTGKVKKTFVLADPDLTTDAITKDDAAGNFDAEEAQLATIKAELDKVNALVAAGAWRTLATTERADTGPPQPNETITVGDLAFSYDLGNRRLVLERDHQHLATHELGPLIPRTKRKPDDPCPGDLPYLGAVHVDAATKKVVVELAAWPQGHNCGGDGPIFTVIPLP